jgi:hypothetical protein
MYIFGQFTVPLRSDTDHSSHFATPAGSAADYEITASHYYTCLLRKLAARVSRNESPKPIT